MTRLVHVHAHAHFQAEFAHALFAQEPSPASPLLAQPAFAVYRNTVMKACVDALQANYPCVARLVGHDWFRGAATLYAADHPPQDGVLMEYGESFPQFLRSFAPAAELSYLPDVARLDRFWSESHTAADAAPLSATHLARLPPHLLADARLRPHPAARWAWFDGQPIYSIWSRNRHDEPPQDELCWQAEGALLTRPEGAVRWQAAGRAECALLAACAAGRSLSEAVAHAQQADPDADLMAAIGRLLRAGAIQDLSNPDPGASS